MFDPGSIASIPGISGGLKDTSSNLLEATNKFTSNPYYSVNIGRGEQVKPFFAMDKGNNQLVMAVVISIAATLIINYMGIGK